MINPAPGSNSLAPVSNLVDRNVGKKRALKKDSDHSPFSDALPQDTSGMATIQSIPTPGELVDFVEEQADNAGDAIGNAGDAIGDAVSDVTEGVGNAVSDGVGAIGDPIDDAGDSIGGPVGDAADELGRTIGNAGDGLGDAIKDLGGRTGEVVRETGNTIGEQVQDGSKWLGDNLHDTIDRGEELVEEAREDANDAIDQFQEDFLGHDRYPHDPGRDQEETEPTNNGGGNDGPVDNNPVDNNPVDNNDEGYEDDHHHHRPCRIKIWFPLPRPVIHETVIVYAPAAPVVAFAPVAGSEVDEGIELPQVSVGATLELAGQDLGQEAGQVLVKIGLLTLAAEVKEWKETVILTLPSFGLAGPTEAELQIIRANGELDTAVAFELIPAPLDTDQE